MDDKARLHRACIVREFRQQEAIDTFQWPAMSLDMNTIEHVWDFIGVIIFSKLSNECMEKPYCTHLLSSE
jgi:hypothetical protein